MSRKDNVIYLNSEDNPKNNKKPKNDYDILKDILKDAKVSNQDMSNEWLVELVNLTLVNISRSRNYTIILENALRFDIPIQLKELIEENLEKKGDGKR